MKRIICLIILACTIFSLVGCACNSPLNSDPPETQDTYAATSKPTPQYHAPTPEPIVEPSPVIPSTSPKSEWGRGRDVSDEEKEMVNGIRLGIRNEMAEYIDGFRSLKLSPVLCLGKKNNVSCLLCRVDIVTTAFTLSYYELYYIEKGKNSNYTIRSEYQIDLTESEKSSAWMQPVIGKSVETWTPADATYLTESKMRIFESACKSETGKIVVDNTKKEYGTSLTAEKYIALRRGDHYMDHCFLCSVDGRETYSFVYIRQAENGECSVLSVSYSNIAKTIDATLRFDE